MLTYDPRKRITCAPARISPSSLSKRGTIESDGYDIRRRIVFPYSSLLVFYSR